MEPTFDADGYPTEETLEAIRHWPFGRHGELVEYLSKCWHWGFLMPELSEDGLYHLYLATGGWSGNESIIAALKGNVLFWEMWWEKSQRGGAYTFLIRPDGWESDKVLDTPVWPYYEAALYKLAEVEGDILFNKEGFCPGRNEDGEPPWEEMGNVDSKVCRFVEKVRRCDLCRVRWATAEAEKENK